MTRVEQIEQLAKAWEALGDGREVRVATQGKSGPFMWQFDYGVGGRVVGQLWVQQAWEASLDTNDATPCLAILRDVKGEDTDIHHLEGYWIAVWTKLPAEKRHLSHHRIAQSEISRIHAVTLALQERNIE